MTQWDLLPDEEGLKEVYVRYAIAANLAQQVEGSLQTLMMLAIKAEQGLDYEGYKALESVWSRKTLGALIRCANERFGPSSVLDPLLEEARVKRNYLIHHFFNANAERFFDSRHYSALLAELKSVSALMEEARLQLHLVLERAIIASGTTREDWERELGATMIRLIEEAQNQVPDDWREQITSSSVR